MFKKLGNRVGNITVLLNYIVKYMKIVHFMSKMWKKNLLSYKNKNASHEAALERCLWQGLDRNAALSGPHGNWGWWEAVDDKDSYIFCPPSWSLCLSPVISGHCLFHCFLLQIVSFAFLPVCFMATIASIDSVWMSLVLLVFNPIWWHWLCRQSTLDLFTYAVELTSI